MSKPNDQALANGATGVPRTGEHVPPVLEAVGITKRYAGVLALDDVSIALRPGHVHALLGENGAGKSTLIKILSGSVQPDGGTICIRGEEIDHLTPTAAVDAGVSTVFQELSLVPSLSLAQNMYLGREPRRNGRLDKRAMRAGTVRALSRIGFDVDPDERVARLSRAQLQLVEIARALDLGTPILILDEPTASISAGETIQLFDILRRLRSEGVAIVYISHRLGEIRELADTISVLRDGRNVVTVAAADVGDQELIEMMTGRSHEELFPRLQRGAGDVSLQLEALGSDRLEDVSLRVAAGEVVGIAGLVGSGKSEIGRACFGLHPLRHGRIEILGREYRKLRPATAMRAGLIYYPADRLREGLVMTGTLGDNLSLPGVTVGRLSRFGFLKRRVRATATSGIIDKLAIRPADPNRPILGFSGGNQQKALLGRSFARNFGVHIFDEPTVGIDVGAKVEVYRHIAELCESGAAVLIISSDMEEIVGIAHRVYVVREGRVVKHIEGAGITEEAILSGFFGDERPDENRTDEGMTHERD